jgi:hypothetical protein
MAYFLGRDIDIAITTEHPTQGVVVKTWDNLANKLLAGALDFATGTNGETRVAAGDKTKIFAGPLALSTAAGLSTNDAFGDLLGVHASGLEPVTWDTQPNNLTSLDVSLGVQDEDVAFIGQRNILKAEVKKENSLSLTRKKSDAMWDAVYNDARFGIKESNTVTAPTVATPLPGVFTGLSAPDFVGCGYRVVVRFNETVPVLLEVNSDEEGDGTLAAAETEVTVSAASAASLSVNDLIKIDQEIMLVTAISSQDLTITRAQRGTEDAAHANGFTIYTLGAGNEGEVLIFRNCYITEHGVSLQVDGSQEETLTLMSYTDPKIYDGITGGEWDDATAITEL